jgi:hypothetical protein
MGTNMVKPRRKWCARTVYNCAAMLRVCLALFGSGYVHPDEHFQSSEIAARDVLHVTAFTPWEFGGNGTTGSMLHSSEFPPFV